MELMHCGVHLAVPRGWSEGETQRRERWRTGLKTNRETARESGAIHRWLWNGTRKPGTAQQVGGTPIYPFPGLAV